MYLYITEPCIAATTWLRPWLKSPRTPKLTRSSGMARCVCRYEQGVRKRNVCYCIVAYVYSHTLHTLVHPSRRAVCAGVSRVSESLIYSAAWCRMYILTPYTPRVCRNSCGARHGTSQPTLCRRMTTVCNSTCRQVLAWWTKYIYKEPNQPYGSTKEPCASAKEPWVSAGVVIGERQLVNGSVVVHTRLSRHLCVCKRATKYRSLLRKITYQQLSCRQESCRGQMRLRKSIEASSRSSFCHHLSHTYLYSPSTNESELCGRLDRRTAEMCARKMSTERRCRQQDYRDIFRKHISIVRWHTTVSSEVTFENRLPALPTRDDGYIFLRNGLIVFWHTKVSCEVTLQNGLPVLPTPTGHG